ncbi:MAG TPA: FtsK/SpoIIIE domain-containing protein, partial [Dermatophilaceae bacterium]|nr:FtsK/SpoIIIE domain-containing protein [Dermatophilaceae bacterium]
MHVLAVAADAADLPSACTQIVDLRAGTPSLTGAQQPVTGLEPDGVPRAWALLLAQRLGPLRDAAATPDKGVIPSRTTLLDVLEIPERDGIPDLAARWRESPRSTLTPIGATASGPLPIDLVRDGPHALVGGTTGSGKSELLVSLVAGLAAANRPDELSFVLVDYKGGAAFGACRDLPHVVGLVTDLDHQLTERALVSLDAELKRRERVFGEHGVADLAAYQGVCRPGDPTVGRLVIVVDEFRSLAEELPDFVTGLVRVASLGRSLGVHLVIATQRPGGVVTADMRANLGLRIALRVRDIVDSLDVVESPVAASIAESTPGRAILTSAATRLVEVQTALATGPSRRAVEPPVRVVSIDGLAVPQSVRALDGPTQVDDLVAASRRAVLELSIPLPGSPWLPPLSGDLTVASLAGGSGWPVPLGRRDVPLHQRQSDWTWDPLREGHLGIVGAPRTGRTTAL